MFSCSKQKYNNVNLVANMFRRLEISCLAGKQKRAHFHFLKFTKPEPNHALIGSLLLTPFAHDGDDLSESDNCFRR